MAPPPLSLSPNSGITITGSMEGIETEGPIICRAKYLPDFVFVQCVSTQYCRQTQYGDEVADEHGRNKELTAKRQGHCLHEVLK